jgi:hypothetical protein
MIPRIINTNLGPAIIYQRFDWTSEDGEVEITFQVSQMLVEMRANRLPYETLTTQLDREFAKRWLPERDLNFGYIQSLSPRGDAKTYNAPVLGVRWIDDSVILIDGSHRYMARFLHSEPTIDYQIVAYKDWQPYATVTRGTLPCAP